ncbi:MAG: hypothetical protein ACLFQA_00330 [Bacteroidales bacterium]
MSDITVTSPQVLDVTATFDGDNITVNATIPSAINVDIEMMQGLPDAPKDGSQYAREDGQWVEIVTDVDDSLSDTSENAVQNKTIQPLFLQISENDYVITISDVDYEWNSEETEATITVTASGGLGHLSYRIDGGEWQADNTFIVTTEDTFAIDVKDEAGQIESDIVTTTKGSEASIFWDTEASATAIQGDGDISNYLKEIRLVGMADNGTINKVIATYENPTIDSGDTDGSQGQVMAEFPKIWYKETINASGYLENVDVADYAKAGFTLHPCFSWGVGRDHVYIGAYEASYIAGVMASVSGQPVQTSQDLAEFRAAAALRGEGCHPYGFWNDHLIQLLYYVWSKDRDSQSVIPGYTEESGWDYAKTRLTGRSNILTEINGSVNADKEGVDSDLTNLSASDAVANRFLFIENFYGHIWKFIDGCSFDGRIGEKKTAFTTPDPRIFSSDQTSILANYDDMDIDLLSVDTTSYIRNVGKAFLPVEGGASSSTFYADLFYSYLTDAANRNYLRSVLAGGYLTLGVSAGVAARYSFFALSVSNSAFGSRLCYSKY